MNRIRKFLESVVYAGMQPGGAPQKKRLRWLGPLAEPVARFLDAGVAPSDPLYLTNRTIGQRVRLAVVILVPCVLVVGGIGLAMVGYFDRSAPPPQQAAALTPEQVAAKMLPDIPKDRRVETNRDIVINDVHVEKGAIARIAGVAHNNTDHLIENAELVFDLTDASGSRLGAVSTKVARMSPNSNVSFSFPVEQHEAAFALVREIKQQ